MAPFGTRRHTWYISLTHKAWTGGTSSRTPPLPDSYVPRASEIDLPPPGGAPTVSIVIPVHNGIAVTARCLASIAICGSASSFEVIVVDDRSTDGTADFLAQIANIVVITNQTNVGYLKSCNAGLARARGTYTVLLNNDTLVCEGWLDALVETAARHPKPTAVGAKLIYPDGALQEAGSIIWSDGSGWNYGRGDDPAAFPYEFVREVDYCSAACLLVPTDLFRQLHGFDEQFSPAYYEDTDLAFAIRAAGGRVLYQPRAEVVHLEGASHGTNTGQGIKGFQKINKPRFETKWACELANQHPPEAVRVSLARDRRSGFRVVIFDDKVPAPDRDSGSVRMTALLRMLQELGGVVTFVPANLTKADPYTGLLQQLGVEVVYAPARVKQHLGSLGTSVGLCVLSRPHVAHAYLPCVRRLLPAATALYDAVDVHFVREARAARLTGTPRAHRHAARVRTKELGVVRSADSTIAVTEDEAELLRRAVPGASVHVLPNVHALRPANPGPEGRTGLLFVGGFEHRPNEDAVLYLISDLMPDLRKVIPGVRLRVVGAAPTESVRNLAGPDVEVLGWVGDLSPLYARSRVFVAPLRYGAGMKGKVGESMAFGLPVVTTAVGAEGFGLTNGKHLLVADEPIAFAEQVRRLYVDDHLWTAVSTNGRIFIEENYGEAAARSRLEAILQDLKLLDS